MIVYPEDSKIGYTLRKYPFAYEFEADEVAKMYRYFHGARALAKRNNTRMPAILTHYTDSRLDEKGGHCLDTRVIWFENWADLSDFLGGCCSPWVRRINSFLLCSDCDHVVKFTEGVWKTKKGFSSDSPLI